MTHRCAVASRLAIATVAAIAAIASVGARAACPPTIPGPMAPARMRAITPDDLLRLRDIGYPDALLMGGPSALAISPDGEHASFLVNQADPGTNGYCRYLVVIPIKERAKPLIADRGGDLITITDVQRGMFVKGGFPALVAPVWSPDGNWIAYLRRDGGITQAWRARADGSGSERLTSLATDVETLSWGRAGNRLRFETRPDKAVLQAAIDNEGRRGWLYDDRVVTFSGARPQIRAAEAPLVRFSLDPATKVIVRDELDPAETRSAAPGFSAAVAATSVDGRRAWVEMHGLASSSDSELKTYDAARRTLVCAAAECRGGIVGLWWSPSGNELRYLRRQGWNQGDMALYRWTPGQARPRAVFVTSDALTNCAAAGEHFVCTRENATTPRHVVRIDPISGRSVTLFDPNPEFAAIKLGPVERLKWKNNRGLEAWGDLALPPGYRPGVKLPLVVVQYSSRGFLRGGTADEYPIHAFAARGVAVLSFEKPPFVATLDPSIKDWTAFQTANNRDWSERRSLLSAIETGVQMVIDRGIADPSRIGITGLSDGATTARFALLNSKLFSAASISSCCLEPWTVNTYVGMAYADQIQSLGYPSLTRPNPAFWKDMSLAQNAARMRTPLLMQLNDDDGYIMALEAFQSLREYGQPVEMYVFPGEYHAKWQPLHRRAIYERNLDWFDFWLRGVEDPNPNKTAQYERWRGMAQRLRTTPRESVVH